MRSNNPQFLQKLCRDIGMAQLLAGRLDGVGAVVLSFAYFSKVPAWRGTSGHFVSTNSRDLKMPRAKCMTAGPALLCTCSEQGMLDGVRYHLLACPENELRRPAAR
jgi:hypothetical protein